MRTLAVPYHNDRESLVYPQYGPNIRTADGSFDGSSHGYGGFSTALAGQGAAQKVRSLKTRIYVHVYMYIYIELMCIYTYIYVYVCINTYSYL